MLAELALDIGTITSILKGIAAAGLIGFAAFSGYRYFKPKTLGEAASPYRRKDTDRSSDAPPPPGFADHLKIIEETAPNAGPVVWWEYAKAELTEAEVAIAEAKLANHGQDKA